MKITLYLLLQLKKFSFTHYIIILWLYMTYKNKNIEERLCLFSKSLVFVIFRVFEINSLAATVHQSTLWLPLRYLKHTTIFCSFFGCRVYISQLVLQVTKIWKDSFQWLFSLGTLALTSAWLSLHLAYVLLPSVLTVKKWPYWILRLCVWHLEAMQCELNRWTSTSIYITGDILTSLHIPVIGINSTYL